MLNWIRLPMGDVVNANAIQRIYVVPVAGSGTEYNVMIQVAGQDGAIVWNTEGGLSPFSAAQNVVTNLARAAGRIAWPAE